MYNSNSELKPKEELEEVAINKLELEHEITHVINLSFITRIMLYQILTLESFEFVKFHGIRGSPHRRIYILNEIKGFFF